MFFYEKSKKKIKKIGNLHFFEEESSQGKKIVFDNGIARFSHAEENTIRNGSHKKQIRFFSCKGNSIDTENSPKFTMPIDKINIFSKIPLFGCMDEITHRVC